MGLFDFMKKKDSEFLSSGIDSRMNNSNNTNFKNNPLNNTLNGMNQNNPNNHSTNKPEFSSSFNSQPFYNSNSNQNLPNNQFESHSNRQNSDLGHAPAPLDRDGRTINHNNNHSMHNNSGITTRDMDIILSKLDAIRLAVQNIDHRITAIESKLASNNTESSSKESYTKDKDVDNIY